MVLQVFEYDTITVGEKFQWKHFNCLRERMGKESNSTFPYYSVVKEQGKDGIKFKQFVGVIQVYDLTIEILPKTDRSSENMDWKSSLLYMLSQIYKLKIYSETQALQNVTKSSILDLVLSRFLEATEEILHQGLVKTYRFQRENTYSLKGRLQFSEHLIKNNIHKERFFVNHSEYDYSHIMNRILLTTVDYIKDSHCSSAIRQRAAICMNRFPEIEKVEINERLFELLTYNRKTKCYKDAISLAELIHFNNMPNLSSGKRETFSMLFDMNKLWEEFVYVTLRKNLSERYTVKEQVHKHFWESQHIHIRKKIKPDILVKDREIDRTFVLDTKWKQPNAMSPSDSDLHQMYAYYKYFDATKVSLVYPASTSSEEIIPGTFSKYTSAPCDLLFLPIPRPEEGGKLWQKQIATTIEGWLNFID